jgi:hypothetical protein
MCDFRMAIPSGNLAVHFGVFLFSTYVLVLNNISTAPNSRSPTNCIILDLCRVHRKQTFGVELCDCCFVRVRHGFEEGIDVGSDDEAPADLAKNAHSLTRAVYMDSLLQVGRLRRSGYLRRHMKEECVHVKRVPTSMRIPFASRILTAPLWYVSS